MPVSGVISLADANVWLALAFSDHQHHMAARAWFDQQSDDSCGFCRITQLALLRHLTNERIMGRFVQNQRGAWNTYHQLAGDSRVFFFNEPAGLEKRFQEFTQLDSPGHALWTDAYLAAFAIAHGTKLATFDQGFKRFAGVDLLLIGSANQDSHRT